MRRKLKRTVTTIETHEVITLRVSPRIQCPYCSEISQMFTPAEAALQTNVSQRVVYQWIEAGLIHFAETSHGGVFVCLSPLNDSLLELTENTKGTQQ